MIARKLRLQEMLRSDRDGGFKRPLESLQFKIALKYVVAIGNFDDGTRGGSLNGFAQLVERIDDDR